MRFLCEDVHQVWQRWSERVDGKIRDGIKITLDGKPPELLPDQGKTPVENQATDQRKRETRGKGGVEDVDVGYSGLRSHLEKSLLLLAAGVTHACAVCTTKIKFSDKMVLICAKAECRAVTHMTCLSKRFIDEEGVPDDVVPISGSCPHCEATLQWIDVVKEMSLRMRGETEVARLMKRPTVRKTKAAKETVSLQSNDLEGLGEFDYEECSLEDTSARPRYESEDPLPADWYHQVDDEGEVMSDTSVDSEHLNSMNPLAPKLPVRKLEVVIEDSDWSNAEVLD